MTPFLTIKLDPKADALVAQFGNRAGLGQAIARGMDVENERSLNIIQAKLSGPVLNVRTGTLRRSMQRTDAIVITNSAGFEVRSSLGSNVKFGGNAVKYAAVHEFGTGPYTIKPKTAGGTLHFYIGGHEVFAKSVKHPGQKARMYLRGTVAERAENYNRTTSGNIVAFFETGK